MSSGEADITSRFELSAGSRACQLDIGVLTVMQRVARIIGRDLHVELRVPVADVAAQEVGAAGDLEDKPFARRQSHRLRRQAEAKSHRHARRKRLGRVNVDGDLSGGGARLVDPAAGGADRAHGQELVGAIGRAAAGAGHHVRIDLVGTEGEAQGNGAAELHLLLHRHLEGKSLVSYLVEAGGYRGPEGYRRPSVRAAFARLAGEPVRRGVGAAGGQIEPKRRAARKRPIRRGPVGARAFNPISHPRLRGIAVVEAVKKMIEEGERF